MDTKILIQQIQSGLLLRGIWSATAEDGRQRLCAYAALMNDPHARPKFCPASLMPTWMAELIPWMDDSGTIERWHDFMLRLAAVAQHFESITPEQWDDLSRRIRSAIVREAVSHITVDHWGVRAACEAALAAIESGDREAAALAARAAEAAAAAAAAAATKASVRAEAAASRAAVAAEWAARVAAEWAARVAAEWAARVAEAAAEAAAAAARGAAEWAEAAAEAAEWAARGAAAAAAGAAAGAAAAAAAAAGAAAGADRIIDAMLTELEAACHRQATALTRSLGAPRIADNGQW